MTHLPRASARAAALLAGAMLCVVVTPGAALADESAEPITTTESAPAPEPASESAPEPATASAPEAAPASASAPEAAPASASAPAAAPAPASVGRSAEGPVTALAAPDPTDACFPGACISNGTVHLGVNDEGSLIVYDGEAGELVGLQQESTGNDGLRAGGPYEGWGVGDAGTGVSGQSLKALGGSSNLTVESFDVTPTTATSVVTVGDPQAPTFRVTHAFTPSLLDPNVYVIRVRIENLTDGTLDDVRYRRVMDWDAEPTAFSELVSVVDRDVAVVGAGTDFVDANVLGSDFGTEQGDVDDRGPDDLVAHFDLGFGSLAAGDFVEFFLFYGVAPTEAEALDSLATVGADSYSTARPSSSDDGAPGTYFFGYNPFPEGLEEAPVDPTDPTDPTDPVDPTDPSDPAVSDGGDTSNRVTPAAATVPVSAAAQLPATGADSMAPFVVAGVALLAGGVAMVGLGRRRVEQA
ncbi:MULTISPECIES: LPXTG cell wall anchor domain-containing protein [unclassified Aeromicrobium]|uniref:LPXTG cell wall anchor domain-containing protein n=1 Tax=unclassified Aeromicrobium TaxID=2633570 RepID=UPI0006F6066C|nr:MULTISPECIES: LPXTG cell wall anchor domain-containing protein [unclassified Aeromicrobium]KQO39498.1 hypothetical protein ASF05_15810 [Aeromicrobium sp. Leaf245]KQP26889.1 hypothetical protein ASF38_07855 [Aeromicrobium sp. Leaf272]KQP78007.1 hypothetical protein ASF37_05150 [Aeromicrobium sp. Leaf289]